MSEGFFKDSFLWFLLLQDSSSTPPLLYVDMGLADHICPKNITVSLHLNFSPHSHSTVLHGWEVLSFPVSCQTSLHIIGAHCFLCQLYPLVSYNVCLPVSEIDVLKLKCLVLCSLCILFFYFIFRISIYDELSETNHPRWRMYIIL